MNRSNWQVNSWKKFDIKQQPNWPDKNALDEVIKNLNSLPALVFAGETRQLKEELAKLEENNSFILQAGNCAESFSDCNGPKIHNFLRVILQMSSIIHSISGKNIINMGRVAGQYAKPRSHDIENINGKNIEVYRGDNVNDYDSNEGSRIPNPKKLIDGYFHSAATLNLIRAFTQGGYTDFTYHEDWSRHLFHNEINKLSLTRSSKINKTVNREIFYISHEALILDYETAFTRKDTINNGNYNASAHSIWIGDRTRYLNSAHIEYTRGIENPVGVKVGPTCDIKELISILEVLNPENAKGKIMLIVRLGIKNIEKVNILIDSIVQSGQNVIWMCDPMHGNTETFQNIKFRDFDIILKEFINFVETCRSKKIYVGGIHLEITGERVTECIGGKENISKEKLSLNYQTKVDPRLNALQSAEFSIKIGEKLKYIEKK